MSIDASKLNEIFHYKQSDNKLKGKIINVVNQIPFNCFIQNRGIEKLNLNTQNLHYQDDDHCDPTPISHLQRRRPTIVSLGQTNIWQLSTRKGHSAMYAALDSLKKDYRTLYIGSTGTILTHGDKQPVDSSSVSDNDKESLRSLLRSKHDMIPIFLDEKLSFGHYEGYSKQGKKKK